MDIGSNYLASTAANVSSSAVLSFFKYIVAHTSSGRVRKGKRLTSEAISILRNSRDEIKAEDLVGLSRALHDSLSRGTHLTQQLNRTKWPWAHLDSAKAFTNFALELKSNAVHTSEKAAVNKFMTAVEDEDVKQTILETLDDVIATLRGGAMANSRQPNEPAIGPSPFEDPNTPTGSNVQRRTDHHQRAPTAIPPA